MGNGDSVGFGVRCYALARRVDGSLGPVGGTGLVENVADVVAHSLDANEEFLADLPVGLSATDQAEHFDFVLC